MVSDNDMRGLFSPAKNSRLARIISIESPAKFRTSIKKLMEGGLSGEERRALTLAKTRATLQLRRRNLSDKERKEFRIISKMVIPQTSKSMSMKKKPSKGVGNFIAKNIFS